MNYISRLTNIYGYRSTQQQDRLFSYFDGRSWYKSTNAPRIVAWIINYRRKKGNFPARLSAPLRVKRIGLPLIGSLPPLSSIPLSNAWESSLLSPRIFSRFDILNPHHVTGFHDSFPREGGWILLRGRRDKGSIFLVFLFLPPFARDMRSIIHRCVG